MNSNIQHTCSFLLLLLLYYGIADSKLDPKLLGKLYANLFIVSVVKLHCFNEMCVCMYYNSHSSASIGPLIGTSFHREKARRMRETEKKEEWDEQLDLNCLLLHAS